MKRSAAVALVLAASLPVSAATQNTTCASATPVGASWARWGGDLGNSRYLVAGTATLARRDLKSLGVRWALSLGETVNARSQPAVAGNTVFVGAESGHLHAVDITTGCTRWTFKSDMPIRSGLVVGPVGGDSLVWYGDLAGSVHAIDLKTGVRRWKRRVDPHFAAIVTGTPQFYEGVLYVPVSSYESALPAQPSYACCGFRGSVVALDARSGEPRWKTWTIADSAVATGRTANGIVRRGPSGAAVWSTPTIDTVLKRLYVGTGNNYSDPASPMSDAIIAMELGNGHIVWARQFTRGDAYNLSCDIPGGTSCPASSGPDADFGQPPMLVRLPDGSRRLLAAQKSGEAHALDPDREGAVVWTTRVSTGGKLGGAHWGSATDGRLMFVAIGGQGILPVGDTTLKEGFRLEPDPAQGGGLVALDIATGKERWRAPAVSCTSPSTRQAPRAKCSPAQSAPVTVVGDLVFSAALDGVIRAYDKKDGRILWSNDTVRDYHPVNGGRARGGAIDVAGPVVVGRTLLVMSGYALYGGQPGNVLLAFTP